MNHYDFDFNTSKNDRSPDMATLITGALIMAAVAVLQSDQCRGTIEQMIRKVLK